MKRANPATRAFLFLMGDEKRQRITIPVLAILISVVASSIVLLIMGKNPLEAFASFFQGSGILPKRAYGAKQGMLTDFLSLVDLWTPMLFASLAVAVAMRAGLFNIGVSGQMLLSGFVATVTVGYAESLPAAVAKPLVVVVGVVVGALVASIIGILKHKWNINEVVTAIMLNYIIRYIVSFFVKAYFNNPNTRQSWPVSEASRLTLQDLEIGGLRMDIPLGFLLAVAAVVLVQFLFSKMKLGFELRAIGGNPVASRYAGINVGRNTVLVMTLSGALAGLAGVTYYLGYLGSIQPDVLISTGFDAIAVCILGNSNPIGIIFSSLLISIIDKGSTYLQSSIGVRSEIGDLITGLILLFSACGAFIAYLVNRGRQREEDARRLASGERGKEERV